MLTVALASQPAERGGRAQCHRYRPGSSRRDDECRTPEQAALVHLGVFEARGRPERVPQAGVLDGPAPPQLSQQVAVEHAALVDVLDEGPETRDRLVDRRTGPQPIRAGQHVVQDPWPRGGRTGRRGVALAGWQLRLGRGACPAAQPAAAAAAVLEIPVEAFERLPGLASAAVRAAEPQRAVVDVAPHDAGARPAQLVVSVAPELTQVVVARRAPGSGGPQPGRRPLALRQQRQIAQVGAPGQQLQCPDPEDRFGSSSEQAAEGHRAAAKSWREATTPELAANLHTTGRTSSRVKWLTRS